MVPLSAAMPAQCQRLERWRHSKEAAHAIVVADQLEVLHGMFDKGITSATWLKEMDVEEAIDVLTARHTHAVRRLKAANPGLPDLACSSEPRLADEQNSMRCSYGFGRVVLWPWALHLPALGYCDYDCRCEVLCCSRAAVVEKALGEWPKDFWK